MPNCRRIVVVLFNPLQRDKGVHTFPKHVSQIARLEFELTYNDDAVQHVSHYSKEPSCNKI